MKKELVSKGYYVLKNLAIVILLISFIISSTLFGYNTYRLVKVGQQLESVRVEYARSTEQLESVRNTVARTSSILNKSTTTISELREQLAAVKQNYILMEKYINSDGDYSGL